MAHGTYGIWTAQEMLVAKFPLPPLPNYPFLGQSQILSTRFTLLVIHGPDAIGTPRRTLFSSSKC